MIVCPCGQQLSKESTTVYVVLYRYSNGAWWANCPAIRGWAVVARTEGEMQYFIDEGFRTLLQQGKITAPYELLLKDSLG